MSDGMLLILHPSSLILHPFLMYLIGDIHGQYAAFTQLLRESGLVDSQLRWTGERAALWLMGDFVDRGPDGIGAVELAIRLQHEAEAAGGQVHALLGNHDVLLLAAHRFGDQAATGPGGSFTADWLRNGGVLGDRAQLQPKHIAWLANLPALALQGDTLLAHADATFYLRYGSTVEQANNAFRHLLAGDDAAAWDRLLDDFSERLCFSGENGGAALSRFLGSFGARRLIHGHTPISYMNGAEPADVTKALVYAGARCVNVDGGMYLGGPGFVYVDDRRLTESQLSISRPRSCFSLLRILRPSSFS